MTDYQYAWMLYLIGATGCVLAAWLLFRRFGRAVTHFFVITVIVLLLTPYAIDAESMTMAPAIYSLLFGFMDGGFSSIKPVLKLMLMLWGGSLILSLIYQLLTRNGGRVSHEVPETHRPQAQRQKRNQVYVEDDEADLGYSHQTRHTNSGRGLTREERIARDELLNEEPIRAIR